MIPWWFGLQIGSDGKKGLPIYVPLLLVYLLMLLLVLPLMLFAFLLFLKGRKGVSRKIITFYGGVWGMLFRAKGFSLFIEDESDRIRMFVK